MHQRFHAVLPAVTLLALLAGCSGQQLNAGPTGLAPQVSERVSLAVAQTRAQFPQFSAAGVPYRLHQAAAQDERSEPEPALQGEGTPVRPGVSGAADARPLQVTLHLSKRGYATGFLAVRPAGGGGSEGDGDAEPERWPIVAYEQRGEADGAFDFTYVLAEPGGSVRYLVVIGGPYEAEGADYYGFEGTLIEPGPGNDLRNWRLAYKLDFGARFPVPPAWQPRVAEADGLFDQLRTDAREVNRLQADLAEMEARIAALQRNEEAEPGAVETLEERLAERQSRLDTLLAQVQERMLRYYDLRRAIAGEYAAFVNGNRYRWMNTTRRQRSYDRWKTVELHHPRIDEIVRNLQPLLPDGRRVLRVRRESMDLVREHDNWSTDPSRSQGASPRGRQ